MLFFRYYREASILNLLAIAMDRYWAVTNVDYIYRRTRARVNTMILCAWTVGAVVSLAPIFGWKDPDFAKRVLIEHKCMVSQDVAYQIFATISTFYAPLVLLLALYWRIFQVSDWPLCVCVCACACVEALSLKRRRSS